MKRVLKQLVFVGASFLRSNTYRTNRVKQSQSKRNIDLAIIGNANIKGFEELNIENREVLMMNAGPSIYEVVPDIYLFEMPHLESLWHKYIHANLPFVVNSLVFFRPNSKSQLSYIEKLITVNIPSEQRLVPWINWHITRLLIRALHIRGIIPFYRSSISFAVFLAKKLGYRSIKLYNFDPYNKSGIFDAPHPTSVMRDSLNVYSYLNLLHSKGLLIFEKDETCLF